MKAWSEVELDRYEKMTPDEQAAYREQRDRDERSWNKGADLAEQLTNIVNAYDHKAVEGFVTHITRYTHRTLQQCVFGVFLKCIYAWAESSKDPGGFDPRNEFTVLRSAQIKTLLEDEMPPFL